MSYVLHRNLHHDFPTAVRGEGVYLFDAQGKKYLDGSGGAAVSCLGHSHPRVIEAVRRQIGLMPFAHTSFFTNEPNERLAEVLVTRAPKGFGAGRAAFVGSGSEAMEVALKLARQYHVERGEPQRVHFIGRRMSYHGNTLGALSVGGHMQRRAVYAPILLSHVSHIEPCHPYRHRKPGETEKEYGLRAANALETEILRIGPERVAAFIAEPMVGATLGCVPAVPGYFSRIREICDRYGVLFIADEVMCGMGRTGALYACEQENICPDMITCAKGLGAGYQPIAAVLAAERVVAPLESGTGMLANGHTYMGHPVACAAGLAALETIETEGLLANIRAMGEKLNAGLVARFAQHPHVGDIRGRGLLQAIEFVADRETKDPLARSKRMAEKLKANAFARGLICYPAGGTADGANGDHVVLAPPYIITDTQIDELLEKLDLAITATFEEIR